MAKKRKRKVKEPFWKKFPPEIQHIGDHIGKVIDNSSLKDVTDVALMSALALVGFDYFKDPRGALIGPIGYKLATTMGGTPPVSQIAGLTILGALGVASYAPGWAQAIAEAGRVADEPMKAKPFYDQWVMATITGSTRLQYCPWVRDFHGLTPEICQIT